MAVLNIKTNEILSINGENIFTSKYHEEMYMLRIILFTVP